MSLNIAKEVAALGRMTVKQLRARYAEVFGEECRSRHKQLLVKRIAWRLQALTGGDLSERARMRAAELANDADLRLHAPTPRGGGVSAFPANNHGLSRVLCLPPRALCSETRGLVTTANLYGCQRAPTETQENSRTLWLTGAKRPPMWTRAGKGADFSGGEAGIRTLGTLTGTYAFQAYPIGRSGTSPPAATA